MWIFINNTDYSYIYIYIYQCKYRYAPVLRPLRTIAQHIPFRKVPTLTIAKRLQDICDNEGLDTDLRALSLLCDMTDGDLRSCLNTLQV